MKYRIWILFFFAIFISRNVFCEIIETLPYEPLSMITDTHGDKWYCFGIEGGGVVRESRGILEQFTPENSGIDSDKVKGIAEDTFGNIWFIHTMDEFIDLNYACSSYNGNEWNSYYLWHFIEHWWLDEKGQFWINCNTPFLGSERQYDCYYDGER
ncbi:hypothetical protein ACFL50_00865 [Candidatus Latescibacterota bacterium]